jgi:hypothetical protein
MTEHARPHRGPHPASTAGSTERRVPLKFSHEFPDWEVSGLSDRRDDAGVGIDVRTARALVEKTSQTAVALDALALCNRKQ